MPTTCSLSSPFLAHACTAVAAASPPEGDDPEKEETDEDSEADDLADAKETTKEATPAKKRDPLFKRKVPIKGRHRSNKLRVLPTKAQWVEVKRIYAAARTAYNFANQRVRNDKARVAHLGLNRGDIGRLKREWALEVKDPTHEDIWGVAQRFSNNAIKDLVDTYRSNEARLKRTHPNRRRPYTVKDRTVESRSEVVHIDRVKMLLDVVPVDATFRQAGRRPKSADDASKGAGAKRRKRSHAPGVDEPMVPKTPQTERRRRRSTTARRAECGLVFGNNLESVGALRVQGKAPLIAKILSAGRNLHAAAKLQWDKTRNALYFIWVEDVPILPDDDPAFEHKRIVSLDPGSAPFQQWYSPTSGEFGELLSGEGAVLKQRRQRLDRLRARVNRRRKAPADFVTQRRKAVPRRKRNLKRQRTTRQLARKLAREETRLAGYMESAHYDAAHFLLERHHLVVAPVLQTGRLMCRDSERRAGRHLSRAMYMWAHRLFRQRLAYTALKYPGRYVFECSEPGTSKTCTQCGAWKAQLRLGDKVFSCSHCGILVDRQLAGARNNFFAAYGMATGNGWDGVGG